MTIPLTTLHGIVDMPMLGLGVFKTQDGHQVREAVTWALEQGYRLIDTAAIYQNERGVGEAIEISGIPRDEIFVTTKLWNTEQGYDTSLAALSESLERLGMDHVDLYLIHWPVPDKTEDTWKAMEHLHSEGLARAIGISNFEPHHLDQLMANASVAPAVNQVELHPHLQQTDIRAANAVVGCLTQSWSPLKQGQVLSDETLLSIASELNVSPAQVAIRWQLQSDIAVIPKSVAKHRIRENREVFGFALTDDHMASIAALDVGDRVGPHPDHRDF
ncbi:MAG: aldo/keto reductase [Actinomycetia bacterium]|nr:aldo/keto reductase [Actinomycetes bacterium]